jgi:hypothetical protein
MSDAYGWYAALGLVLVVLYDCCRIAALTRQRDESRAVVNSLTERLATQSDILSRRAEKPPAPWAEWRRIEAGHVLRAHTDAAAAVARLRAAEPRREN